MRSLSELHDVISKKALANPISIVGIQAQELTAIVSATKDAADKLPDDAKAKAVWKVMASQVGHAPKEVLGIQSGHLLELTSLINGPATGPTPTAAETGTGGLLTGTIPPVIAPPTNPTKPADKEVPAENQSTTPTKPASTDPKPNTK